MEPNGKHEIHTKTAGKDDNPGPILTLEVRIRMATLPPAVRGLFVIGRCDRSCGSNCDWIGSNMRHRGRRRSQPEGAAQLLRSMVGQLLHATGLALARLRYRIIRVIIPLQPSNRCLRFRLQVRLQQSDWGGGQKNQSKLKLAWRFAIRGTNGELG